MQLLYSNILPMKLESGQHTIREELIKEFGLAKKVKIAVGYISEASLNELDELIHRCSIEKCLLIIGMYSIEGMPERSYHLAVDLSKKWREEGKGEIRIVRPFKYHGKVYLFSDGENLTKGILGSANLSVLKPDASTIRQYELCMEIDNHDELKEIDRFIDQMGNSPISEPIEMSEVKIVREKNTSLNGIERVSQIPPNSVELYREHKTNISFKLPLKVPAYKDRLSSGKQFYTKSNLNVCYAAPRNKRKSRDWFETQLTVSAKITRIDGYPEKHVPFFIVTDDGYWFKAHTTSSGNKQFAAVGDELIMGRWLKGRLVAAGLVKPVNDTGKDINKNGMITKEMLSAYGCDCLVFTKTDQKSIDPENNEELDVWYLSFEANKDK